MIRSYVKSMLLNCLLVSENNMEISISHRVVC